MALPVPSARELIDGTSSPAELAERKTNAAVKSAREVASEYGEFVQEMKKATIAGLTGETDWDRSADTREVRGMIGQNAVGAIRHDPSRHSVVTKAMEDFEMAKSTEGTGPAWERMSKEWSLTTPINTGLVPFDLEAPAKLLTPRPTPLRNSIARVKGQGGSRRFKVISGFTGTGTGGITTTQPGIGESTTNSGPGGLSYIRGPYISYAGYDVTFNKSVAA